MNKEYPKMKYGQYWGKHINEIPMDYLIWLFPTMQRSQKDLLYYRSILIFFLERDVRVEHENELSYFYFNDYKSLKPPGIDKEFLISNWRGKNSLGENIYEVKFLEQSFFIAKENGKFVISKKYVSHKYLYGKTEMIYEKNDLYYFKDGLGNITNNAFLIRKPYVPEDFKNNDFSENIKADQPTYIYRLFAIQTFGNLKVAVYTKYDKLYDVELITDALELTRNKKYLLADIKPWKYKKGYFHGVSDEEFKYNMQKIFNYLKIFYRGINILESNNNIDKALFFESTLKKDWHGEHNLYENLYFDLYKSSYPEFSGCKFLRKINL
jgi:hypothetical protein